MHIQLQRISNTHHRLSITRPDGSSESVELETKSYLKHDLIHLAVESSAKLQGGFWGRLARGSSIEELNAEVFAKGTTPQTEAEVIEVVVGAFTGYVDRDLKPEDLINGLGNMMEAYWTKFPEFVSIEMIEAAGERYRQLMGEWSSLAFGEVMTVEWNV